MPRLGCFYHDAYYLYLRPRNARQLAFNGRKSSSTFGLSSLMLSRVPPITVSLPLRSAPSHGRRPAQYAARSPLRPL